MSSDALKSQLFMGVGVFHWKMEYILLEFITLPGLSIPT